MIQRHFKKLAIVALLITLGLALEVAGLLDARQLLAVARGYAQHWWLIPILILAQAVLFTFALAGSIFLWIVAPLFSPAMAAFPSTTRTRPSSSSPKSKSLNVIAAAGCGVSVATL